MAFTAAFCPAGAHHLPEWVPDSTCSQCSACRSPFTLLRRRHHCRSCGKVGGGLGWGCVGSPGGPSSAQPRSGLLPADLLCPLLATRRGAAALRPAETRARLHALLRRPPLTPACLEPVRDPCATSASVGSHKPGGQTAARGLLGGSAAPRLSSGWARRQDLLRHARWQPVPQVGGRRTASPSVLRPNPAPGEPRAAVRAPPFRPPSGWKCASWWWVFFLFQVNFGCCWGPGQSLPPLSPTPPPPGAWSETVQTALT